MTTCAFSIIGRSNNYYVAEASIWDAGGSLGKGKDIVWSCWLFFSIFTIDVDLPTSQLDRSANNSSSNQVSILIVSSSSTTSSVRGCLTVFLADTVLGTRGPCWGQEAQSELIALYGRMSATLVELGSAKIFFR